MQENKLRVIKLTGSPLNRGRIHGEELRSEICRLSEEYQNSIELLYEIPADEYIGNFLRYQNFATSIEAETPHLLEEVRGISEGADLPFNRMLLLQLIDEEWVYGRTIWPDRKDLDFRTKCTSFGIEDSQNSRSFAGQNMDIPPFHEGGQVVFHICYEKSDLEAFVFSSAGVLGLMGLNNAPLGVCCNTLMELPSSNNGLPVAFLLRRLLEQTSFSQAQRFLRTVHHASGQNFLLSSRQEIGSFECSAENVSEAKDTQHPNWVCHTNHVLVDGVPKKNLQPRKLENSKARFSSINNRITKLSDSPDIDTLKNALSVSDDASNPVSRKLKTADSRDVISYTAGSAIYEMGATPRLHIAPGPPCETNYRILEFEKF